jgi:mRNA interferase RelE/StbE
MGFSMNEPTYRLLIKQQPQKVLRRVPSDIRKRIDLKIKDFSTNPRPEGCKKLMGYDNLYRIRVGNWRISYAVEDEELILLILEISPRGDAYRSFR